MSTSDKLTYLDGTKQALKTSINNIGGEITSATTFREYAQELDNIYDNLPKTTGEGTNLSLNTIKGKMNIIPKGDTQQTQYSGYQMISIRDNTTSNNGITAVASNGEITLNGTASANAFLNIQLNYTYTLEVGQTYTITCNNTSHIDTNAPRFRIDEAGTYDTYMSNNNAQKTITWEGGSQYTSSVYIRVASGTTLTNFKLKPMIEKGSTAHTYEPYVGGIPSPNPTFPQPIEVVTGTQEVKVCNKNLLKDFRPNTQTLNGVTFTNNGNGTLRVNGTSSAYTQFVDSDSFTLAKGTYTLSGRSTSISGAAMQLRSPDGYTTIIQTNTKTTFTLSEDTQVRFRIVLSANTTYTNVDFEPMILSGDMTQNIPTYTPHQEQTQTLSLGDIELRKIGTYQDYLYKSNDKWYKKENIGKYTFTGNETIDQFSSRTNTIRFSIANVLPTTLVAQEYNYNAYCNYLKAQDIYNNDVQGFFTHFNGSSETRIYIGLDKTIANTSEQAKTWLGNVKPILYYQLRTPSDIEITNTTLIEQLDNLEKAQSYNGTTNISSSGNLPIVLGVSALKGES